MLIDQVSAQPVRGRAPSHRLLVAALLCRPSFWLVYPEVGLARGARTSQIFIALLVCGAPDRAFAADHAPLVIDMGRIAGGDYDV